MKKADKETNKRTKSRTRRIKTEEQDKQDEEESLTLETRSEVSLVVESSRRCVRTMVNTAWEREDVSFMLVAATVLRGRHIKGGRGHTKLTDSWVCVLLQCFILILRLWYLITFPSSIDILFPFLL